MPATDVRAGAVAHTGCPVCRRVQGAEARCVGCGWPLTSDDQLGELSAAVAARFERRLDTAQHTFDAAVARRVAAVAPERDTAVLARLDPLLRGGPAAPEQLAPDPAVPDLAPVRSDPPLDQRDGPKWVVRLDADGLLAATIDDTGRAAHEHADLAVWPWSSVVTSLSADVDEQRFQLAGGIGRRPLDPVDVRSAIEDWIAATVPGAASTAVLVAVPGWAVPELMAEEICRRWGAVRVSAAPGLDSAGRPLTIVRSPSTITAAAATATRHGPTVVSGTADGSIACFAFPGGEPLAAQRPDDGRVTALDVSTDGVIVTGTWDGGVRVRSLDSPVMPTVLHAHGGRVNAVAARPGVVLSVGDDGKIRRTTLGGGAAPTSVRFPLDDIGPARMLLAVAPDAALVASAGATMVLLWDGSGRPLPPPPADATITCLAIDATGQRIAVGDTDGVVRIHAADGRGSAAVLDGHAGPVRAVAVGRDWAVTGDDGGYVRRWPLGGGASTGDVVGAHTGPVAAVLLPADDLLLSVGAEDKLIIAWAPPPPSHPKGSR